MSSDMTQQGGPFQSQRPAGGGGAVVAIEQTRAMAQVQAAMMVARSMPRDVRRIMDLVLQDCADEETAEEAAYEYSRGGTKITGPSIRLLETIARRYGNMESGIKELSRANGYSECEAYAWDLETGYRDSKTFQVKHWRDKKDGGGYAITDERDIYELVANVGARRKRACMEAVIPTTLVNKALSQCEVTLKANMEITPALIGDMLEMFAKFNVTREMIEKRIQRHIQSITPALVIQMRRIFNSMRDGMSSPADWFELTEEAAAKAGGLKGATADLKAAMGGGSKKEKPQEPPPGDAGQGGNAGDAEQADTKNEGSTKKPAASGPKPLTYAFVAELINKATTAEQLDEIGAHSVPRVTDETQQVELNQLIKSKRESL